MVRQYPDTLTVYTPASASTRDENGDWQLVGSKTEERYDCRYEPKVGSVGSSGNQVIYGQDGQQIDYSGTVYLKTSDAFKIGTSISVLRHNGQSIKGEIKGVEQNQLHTKIWL